MQARLQFVDGSHVDVDLDPADVAQKLRNERDFVALTDLEGREYVVNPLHVVHIAGPIPGTRTNST